MSLILELVRLNSNIFRWLPFAHHSVLGTGVWAIEFGKHLSIPLEEERAHSNSMKQPNILPRASSEQISALFNHQCRYIFATYSYSISLANCKASLKTAASKSTTLKTSGCSAQNSTSSTAEPCSAALWTTRPSCARLSTPSLQAAISRCQMYSSP